MLVDNIIPILKHLKYVHKIPSFTYTPWVHVHHNLPNKSTPAFEMRLMVKFLVMYLKVLRMPQKREKERKKERKKVKEDFTSSPSGKTDNMKGQVYPFGCAHK